MSQSANVRSVDAIRDFRASLATFTEEARTALGGTEMEIRRVRDWLCRDQLTYWQAQIKRRNEQLSMARSELHRRRLSQQGSEAVSDSEQKEAVRLAQKRLEAAEARLALIKRWIPVLEHAITEYHSSSQPLGDSLSGSVVNSLSLLDRTVRAIEAYLATQVPTMEPFETETSSASAPASARSEGTTRTPEPAAPAETPQPEASAEPVPEPAENAAAE